MTEENKEKPSHFIRDIIAADIAAGKHGGKVITRFPPEPNGYLHIGHAKSICLNYGMSKEFNGTFHLRFDDTNPTKEEVEYMESIKCDVKWLGADWKQNEFYASDYFEQMYEYAKDLIKADKAFVCDMTAEALRESRGTPTEPMKPSPNRNRSVEENLDLFERMRNGEFADGEKTLRAKIDLASPNMHMRDPAIYRIRREHHYRTGDKWCIYPMYDFAHPIEDAMEKITHSICTLEFEVHRPLYDWFIENLNIFPSRQYEFARLNLSYTVMSKRKLLTLVENKDVDGWDDPRMPTVSGMRRRGYTPEAIRNFCEIIGVTKFNSLTDVALLEHSVRDHLNKTSPRVMGVFNPVKVIIENYPEGNEESLDAVNNPEDESAGTRKVPFSRELYIEADDFMEEPPKKFFRLAPGQEVRLRWAYLITCTGVEKNADGSIKQIRCTYDPATRGGNTPDGRKVKGTIHWVSARHAVACEAHLYDRLFTVERPDADPAGRDFREFLNPSSLTKATVLVEPYVLEVAKPGYRCQFERIGYFCVDTRNSKPGKPVFNRTVALKDSWAKIAAK